MPLKGKRDVDGLFRVLDPVNEGIVRIELLAGGFKIVLNRFDAELGIGPDAGFQTPSAEHQDTRIPHTVARGHHGGRIVGIFQFTLEDLGPEAVLIVGETLETEPGTRVEVAVRDEVAGLIGALLRLGAFDVFVGDDAIFGIDFELGQHRGDHLFLKLSGQFLGGGQRAAVFLDHGLPSFLVLVLIGGLGHVLDPAIEQFEIELACFHHLIHRLLRFAGDLPNAFKVVRGLEGKRVLEFVQQGLAGFLGDLLLRFYGVFQFGELIDHLLRCARILFIHGVVEDAGKRVVIGLRNGIVLVIVAAGAGDSQAHEAAGYGIDAVMPLISAGDFVRAVVVIPGPEAQKAGAGEHLGAVFGIHQVARELSFDEAIVRHIVVEGLDHPIAITIGVGVGAITSGERLETAVIVFAEAGDIEPLAAPALAIVGRGEETIDQFGVSVWRNVLFESSDLFRRGGKAGEVEGGPADQVMLAGLANGMEAFLFQPGKDEPINFGASPASVFDGGRGLILKGLEGPEVPAFRGDGVLTVGLGENGGAFRPDSSGLDPGLESFDIGGLELAALRHAKIGVRFFEAGDERACGGIAGFERGAVGAAFGHGLPAIESESA